MTQAYNLSQFANRLNTSGQINPSGAFSSVIPINMGGTNNGSLLVTAGGVIYTDGSKMVNVGAGSANQVLTSNGSGAPTWQTPSGGGFSSMQIYTSGSGAWTIPSGKTTCQITVIGGGGAGSGNSGTGANVTDYGAGGGGGGASIKYYTGLTPGNTINYTVGGAAGTSSVSSGTQTITTISATGGGNATGSTAQNQNGVPGFGGTGSGGDINLNGSQGCDGSSGPTITIGGSGGGAGIYSNGAIGTSRTTNQINGNAGSFGGGGSGGCRRNWAAAYSGGAGGNGAIIIEY